MASPVCLAALLVAVFVGVAVGVAVGVGAAVLVGVAVGVAVDLVVALLVVLDEVAELLAVALAVALAVGSLAAAELLTPVSVVVDSGEVDPVSVLVVPLVDPAALNPPPREDPSLALASPSE